MARRRLGANDLLYGEAPDLKRRTIIAHPPLFALYPVLSLYAANVSLVPLADVWIPCLAVFMASLALWGVFGLVFRNSMRGARIASALVFCFFMFGAVLSALRSMSALPSVQLSLTPSLNAWAAATLVITALVGWKWKDDRKLNQLFNLAGALMCLFAVASIAMSFLSVRSSLRTARERTAVVGGTSQELAPDIFYIVLDGYGRDDVLSERFGITDSPLGKRLEDRGFYVASEARANYVQTQLSLASSLNMDFVQSFLEPMGHAERERLALDRLINDSLVARTLKDFGYQTFAVRSGFPALTFSGADVSIGGDVGRSLFLDALIQKTPLVADESGIGSQFSERQGLLRGAFNEVKRLAKRGPTPRFVIVHILAPHPPFVFGPNGEPRRPKGSFNILDGSHFVPQVGSAEVYRDGYRDQAVYIGKLVVETVDALLAQPGPPPVILIQGDHGPKSGLDQESAANTDMGEVIPILSAYFVPDEASVGLYQAITPVNSFRVVLGSLFGMDLPLLKDRSYYSPWSQPLEFVDANETR